MYAALIAQRVYCKFFSLCVCMWTSAWQVCVCGRGGGGMLDGANFNYVDIHCATIHVQEEKMKRDVGMACQKVHKQGRIEVM